MRRTLTALSLLLLLMATNAYAAVALHVDFNGDTQSKPPSTDPAGDPGGDRLQYYAGQGSIEVVDQAGDLVDQPLYLSRPDVGSFFFRAYLDSAFHHCGSYTIRWRSMSPTVQFYVAVALRGSSRLVGGLEYRGGGKLTFNGSTNELPVGYFPNVAQAFEVVVDFEKATTTLNVDGVETPVVSNFFFERVFDRLSIEFGGTNASEFALDDIEVIADACDTPVEESSWGTIKARFGSD